MENIQIVSFNPEMVEAGSARLRPEEAKVIQRDQLEPVFMQKWGALIAWANMDGIIQMTGSALTKVHFSYLEKELGWVFPVEIAVGDLPPAPADDAGDAGPADDLSGREAEEAQPAEPEPPVEERIETIVPPMPAEHVEVDASDDEGEDDVDPFEEDVAPTDEATEKPKRRKKGRR